MRIRLLALACAGVVLAGATAPAAPAAHAVTIDNRGSIVTAEPFTGCAACDDRGVHRRLFLRLGGVAGIPHRALGRAALRHRDTMAPRRDRLWPGQTFPSYVATPRRLLTMARAYATEGTGLTGFDSPALLDAVDHFVPVSRLGDYSGTSTGANRVDLCLVTLLRAMLADDHGRAEPAVSALSPVFRPVSEGDGFYRDGSFIQHTYVPYQGAYGVTLLSGLATLYAVLRGSPWGLADRSLFATVERSFAPFVRDGACMDLVRGRSVGRRPYGDHERGREIAAAVLLLGESAPVAERARWQAMVKGWAVRSTYRPMLEGAEPAFHARLSAVMDDGAVPAVPEPVGHRLLPMSARAVHRRPGWCAALSMASHRIGHYEHGNGENLRGRHTGSGMLYWWAEGHGDHYSDSFWPTVDPYRLPGTTVSTRRLPDGAGAGWGDTCTPWRWVGGATDGTYAVAGQHLSGLESTMEAFKSWFFLDDAIVCLGAGITSQDGAAVETVVDNRRTGDALPRGRCRLDARHGQHLPAAGRPRARAGPHGGRLLERGDRRRPDRVGPVRGPGP
ncbi:polysaccharide lyase family 8 super-sandwich domain-containing protein [Nonomuraea sp. NPDC050643]|uniref:polysaccharide lyase family 8 super-sandwich domain-containing protein n=1 Tax=Nonomuraea sp. NPDC050643 TaxID=3155660 RepID=UPI0033D64D0E